MAFLLIPFVLWGVEGEQLKSISAYAYHSPMTFALSLTMAAQLFINDGIISKNRWYNYIIGLSLFGVVLFPHLDYTIIHYSFAGIFFVGSLFNMIFFAKVRNRFIMTMIVLLTLFGMAGCFIFNWYSIFWAEFIGMIPISLVYVTNKKQKK